MAPPSPFAKLFVNVQLITTTLSEPIPKDICPLPSIVLFSNTLLLILLYLVPIIVTAVAVFPTNVLFSTTNLAVDPVLT